MVPWEKHQTAVVKDNELIARNCVIAVFAGLLVGATVVALPVLEFDSMMSTTMRIGIVSMMILSSLGVYMKKNWGSTIAKLAMWALLIWVVLTITPDREQAVLDDLSVNASYLIIRLLIIVSYTLFMLWLLGVLAKNNDPGADNAKNNDDT